MIDQAPVVIVTAPLFGAILIVLFGWRFPRVCFPVALASLTVSFVSALATLEKAVTGDNALFYLLGGWERLTDRFGTFAIGIEYRVDSLTAIVLTVITAVGLLNAVYSRTRVLVETPERLPHHYILSLLLVTGLAGMTITNDAFNLYVLIEIASLTSYGLIAMGSRRAALSAFNYVIMGTIGASFYLLGVGYLYIKTGTLNMLDIHGILTAGHLEGSISIHVAFLLIMLGVWIKMAFFPLHGWLPNAYAHSPTATGCLMAPLVTKVMVYVMVRMMMSVFGAGYVFRKLGWSHLIVTFSVVAIVAGSLMALSRRDLRKMLTYLIVAEVGYMVGGAWLANAAGMMGALYHIVSDAAMTFCLFLAVNIVIARTGNHRLTAFKGLYGKMPLTMLCFTIGALSMIGLPPTCGFFSKWYLVRGGIEAGQWAYVVALLFSSLVNAVLFFRLFEMAFFQGDDARDGDQLEGTEEEPLPDPQWNSFPILDRVPFSMMAPLVVTAISILIIGLFNRTITGWLDLALETFNLPGTG